jgi:hypothetical protein
MSATRFLPVVLVVAGGALILRAVGGVADLPQMLQGAKAFAEDAAPVLKTKAPGKTGKDASAVSALLAKPPAVSPAATITTPAGPAPALRASLPGANR